MARKKRTAAVNRQELALSAAAPPYVAAQATTRSIMGDVLIALTPALAVSTYFFGPRVIALALVTMAAAVAFELLFRLVTRQNTGVTTDLSAMVTGLLIAMCLPVTAPYWAAVLGAGFAILVVKHLYGGLGRNFLNPALAGHAFLLAFPSIVNLFVAPGVDHWMNWASATVDGAAVTVPMEVLHQRAIPLELSLRQLLLGQRGGTMGEIAAFALILGGLYLIIRRVIHPRIPVCFIGTVAVLTYLFPFGNDPLQWMLYQLLGGGLLLGAIFMATDTVTSPITPRGQILYAIGCGALTVFLRYFGARPEGVGFAILMMNTSLWLFDRLGVPRRFGTSLWPHREKKGGEGDG